MRTEKQNEASRRNGAKSKGPVTEEGKAKSSLNGTKHGLSGSHRFLYSNERDDLYQELLTHYMTLFAPGQWCRRRSRPSNRRRLVADEAHRQYRSGHRRCSDGKAKEMGQQRLQGYRRATRAKASRFKRTQSAIQSRSADAITRAPFAPTTPLTRSSANCSAIV